MATKPDAREKRVLSRARKWISEDRTQRGMAVIENLLGNNDGLAEGHLLMGIGMLRSWLSETPSSETTALEELQEAEFHLLAATRLEPRNPEAHWTLGRLYQKDGHLEAALAAYRTALEFNVQYRPALISAAGLATELGEERDAIRHLEALRAKTPFPKQALHWETRCYLTLLEATDPQLEANHKIFLQRALRAYQELAELQKNSNLGTSGQAYCLFLMAQMGFAKLDSEKIRELWLEAARIDPRDPEPRFNLAAFLESDLVGEVEAAIDAYRSSLDRDPTHLPSMLNLARLLLDRKKGEALELYRRALPKIQDPKEKKKVLKILAGTVQQ